MRKSRFTEAQIIGMIKEQEAGMPTAEVCRRHGLSPATFYKLKSKYGGMEVSGSALQGVCAPGLQLPRHYPPVRLDQSANPEIAIGFDQLFHKRFALSIDSRDSFELCRV